MPTNSPRALTNAPPELPRLMAASVWMKLSMELAPIERAFALTIPAVTVEVRLKGLPTAKTHSPNFKSSELPIGNVGKSFPSILIKAKSVCSSVPIMRPLNSRLSFSFTNNSSASLTTWLLVTI